MRTRFSENGAAFAILFYVELSAFVPLLGLNLSSSLNMMISNYTVTYQSYLTMATHIATLIIEQSRRKMDCSKWIKSLMLVLIALTRVTLWMCSIGLMVVISDNGVNSWIDVIMFIYGILNLLPLFCIIPLVIVIECIQKKAEPKLAIIGQVDAYCAICMKEIEVGGP